MLTNVKQSLKRVDGETGTLADLLGRTNLPIIKLKINEYETAIKAGLAAIKPIALTPEQPPLLAQSLPQESLQVSDKEKRAVQRVENLFTSINKSKNNDSLSVPNEKKQRDGFNSWVIAIHRQHKDKSASEVLAIIMNGGESSKLLDKNGDFMRRNPLSVREFDIEGLIIYRIFKKKIDGLEGKTELKAIETLQNILTSIDSGKDIVAAIAEAEQHSKFQDMKQTIKMSKQLEAVIESQTPRASSSPYFAPPAVPKLDIPAAQPNFPQTARTTMAESSRITPKKSGQTLITTQQYINNYKTRISEGKCVPQDLAKFLFDELQKGNSEETKLLLKNIIDERQACESYLTSGNFHMSTTYEKPKQSAFKTARKAFTNMSYTALFGDKLSTESLSTPRTSTSTFSQSSEASLALDRLRGATEGLRGENNLKTELEIIIASVDFKLGQNLTRKLSDAPQTSRSK
jgi:hypothetical protein